MIKFLTGVLGVKVGFCQVWKDGEKRQKLTPTPLARAYTSIRKPALGGRSDSEVFPFWIQMSRVWFSRFGFKNLV